MDKRKRVIALCLSLIHIWGRGKLRHEPSSEAIKQCRPEGGTVHLRLKSLVKVIPRVRCV